MKTIKIFDGIELETRNGKTKFPDMTLFDKAFKCTDEQRLEIIRHLMGYRELDLTSIVGNICIIRTYREDEA